MLEEQGNTTALIGAWSMDGALELEGSFLSAVDINAMVSERSVPEESVTPPERTPLLMKSAGEDDWQPLPAVAR